MIILKELRWNNAFSYGNTDNKINFIDSPIIQLIGKNGHGKSSVALILEEVLFNKNSKGIKKADILNRYVSDNYYTIELDLEKDGVPYTIKSKRSNTQSIKLYRDNIDISAHTATATYKLVNDIIGIDHKTFTQIVYQSSASSLEFLTATDANRKKFLIELLNLTRYNSASDVFKNIASELNKDISVIQAKVDTVSTWLNKYANTDFTEKEYVEVEPLNEDLLKNRLEIEQQLSEFESLNKAISTNNTYKRLLESIDLTPIPEKPIGKVDQLKSDIAVLNKTIKDVDAFVAKMKKLHGTCPTCLSEIDESQVAKMISEKESEKEAAVSSTTTLKQDLSALENSIKAWEACSKNHADWEKYHSLIDTSLPEEVLSEDDLTSKLQTLTTEIKNAKAKIAKAESTNKSVSEYNATIKAISSQLVEFKQELEVYTTSLNDLTEKLSLVSILTKTFSTNGLVAYKIECLVKDLEGITNSYLVDLSDGRFQIGFKVSVSDKLNVIITDNGKDIDMSALSGGEKARVNVATLLGIRKLMQSLSNSRINLLILDETIDALDIDGKEKLVEVLLNEEHLNTFIVSHGFTHPLLEKVHVVKEHNISRIEA